MDGNSTKTTIVPFVPRHAGGHGCAVLDLDGTVTALLAVTICLQELDSYVEELGTSGGVNPGFLDAVQQAVATLGVNAFGVAASLQNVMADAAADHLSRRTS